MIEEHNNDVPTAEMMDYHGISEENRGRIIDWVVQVLNVLNVSAPSTFFAAVTLMDRYFVAKYNQ